MAIVAVQAIAKMRGESQPLLMRGSDDHLWVVKFQDNPQHIRVLANDFLATSIMDKIGLPVPTVGLIAVPDSLLAGNSEIMYKLGQGRREHYRGGVQFGSMHVSSICTGVITDFLPDGYGPVSNLGDFAGALCADKWTSNHDGRQTVFVRGFRRRGLCPWFIDQGFCFGASEWRFSDAPLWGLSRAPGVYHAIKGWGDFEPWLNRIDGMNPDAVLAVAKSVPPDWYGGDPADIELLVERLFERRKRIPDLLLSCIKAANSRFPNWAGSSNLRQPR